jgi:hypothetical protein
MKKNFIILMFLLLVALLAANQGSITLGSWPTMAQMTSGDRDGLNVRYQIEKLDFKEVDTPEGRFTDLFIADYATTNREGMPRLPLLRQIISVPVGAEVSVSIINADRQTVDLQGRGINYPIIPRQESISKSTDPSKVPFAVNRDFYNRDQWTNDPSISVTEIGFMRGVRMFAVDFVPVRYNAALAQMEVISRADVSVRFIGSDHAATQALLERTYSPAFNGMYEQMLLNPEPVRATLNRYPMSYLIITPENFVSALQPFVEWKTREGYNVIVATTAQTGTTASAIKTYIQNIWSAATTENPAPSYLLIVGDVAQVPSNNGTTGSHVSDLPYVRLQGTDFVPEMYFGRFSATTPAEVTNQVNKTLMHEQYTMPNDAYLGEVVMIAGVDGSFGPTHANGQINYGTNNYFNNAHGINSHTYLYPASGSSDAQIVANVSAGMGYVNYTAHGSETSWADPTFTISNINSLQNINEYPVVVGNCCLTSAFNTGTCFAEAWLRAVDKGAVIYIGGTNSTYWDEDYWWGVGYKPPVVGTGSPYVANRIGAYDAMFHEHNEAFADWGNNVGSTMFMGNMAVVQANSSRINYYWEIYSIMGDPSLIPYLGIPATNSALIQDTMFLGIGTMDVIADPYSYVAISMNNVLHGAGLADANGNLTLNFTPFTEPGTAQVVITRSMRKPMITNIQVVPNAGPYVTISPITVVDPNQNGLAEAGETISMGLTFTNVGIADANNLTATISTTHQDVSILTGSAPIANVPAGGTITVPSIFSVLISPAIDDQAVVSFDISVTDGTNIWATTRSITVNAPNVEVGQVSMNDANGNGFLEAGENVTITLNITNYGHMPADGGSMTVVINNPSVTADYTQFTIPPLAIGVNVPITFVVTIGTDIPSGTVIPVGIAINAGTQMINHTIMLPIGVIGDNFESGDFSNFPWTNTSPQPWTIQSGTANAHGGTYGAKSGTIGNNASSELSITLAVGAAGNISFWRKVSSETNYDWLRFSIDGTEMGSWSGIQDWAQYSYPVQPGTHVFKWVYSKDVSMTGGSDAAWIDDIIFPMSGSGNAALIYSPTTEINFDDVEALTTVSADFVLRNLGNIDLSGMISVPTGFVLSQNGNDLPSDYNYLIPGGGNAIFTISYTVPNPAVNYDGVIIITSNDANNPAFMLPIHVTAGVPNDDPGATPYITKLEGNYPNPFNPETAIRFSLKEAGPVRVSIYNLKGQLVRTLVNGNLNAGPHNLVWNGKDDNNRAVSSGIYMYRMETSGYNKTLKMMLMK